MSQKRKVDNYYGQTRVYITQTKESTRNNQNKETTIINII
jgi:hypothetical protein